VAFDIVTYKNSAHAVSDEDIDYSAFEDRPLSAGALRCLRYMADIESHTVCYLRDLLVTPSHTDPEVTTFLTMWAFEEFWHGEVLAKVLTAHGIATDDSHTRQVRERLGWRDKLAPVGQAVLANVIGVDFVAVHMTWGAVNEWSTRAAYSQLAKLENHPTLNLLLSRIQQQESRHAAFYAAQARERLRRSGKARRLTRFALGRFWEPVGSGVLPKPDTRHMLRFLFGDTHGRRLLRQIDEKIDHLPGLGGLRLIARAASAYGVV
jgi:hypothetical protein